MDTGIRLLLDWQYKKEWNLSYKSASCKQHETTPTAVKEQQTRHVPRYWLQSIIKYKPSARNIEWISETQTWNHLVCLRAASAWRHLPRASTSRSVPLLAVAASTQRMRWTRVFDHVAVRLHTVVACAAQSHSAPQMHPQCDHNDQKSFTTSLNCHHLKSCLTQADQAPTYY